MPAVKYLLVIWRGLNKVMFVSVPYKIKHSTNDVAITILNTFEIMVGRGGGGGELNR